MIGMRLVDSRTEGENGDAADDADADDADEEGGRGLGAAEYGRRGGVPRGRNHFTVGVGNVEVTCEVATQPDTGN